MKDKQYVGFVLLLGINSLFALTLRITGITLVEDDSHYGELKSLSQSPDSFLLRMITINHVKV